MGLWGLPRYISLVWRTGSSWSPGISQSKLSSIYLPWEISCSSNLYICVLRKILLDYSVYHPTDGLVNTSPIPVLVSTTFLCLDHPSQLTWRAYTWQIVELSLAIYAMQQAARYCDTTTGLGTVIASRLSFTLYSVCGPIKTSFVLWLKTSYHTRQHLYWWRHSSRSG